MKLAVDAEVMVGGCALVRVKVWVVVPEALVAVMVIG
jgi:hypothetical protein